MFIRQLAKKYNITRTTLLYYDSINLLKPGNRTIAGYRIYSHEDEKKLNEIVFYRKIGFSIKQIKKILCSNITEELNLLLLQLNKLNIEIEAIKIQQGIIINEFTNKKYNSLSNSNETEIITTLLNGISPSVFHEKFEKSSPVNHQNIINVLDKLPKNTKKSLNKYIAKYKK